MHSEYVCSSSQLISAHLALNNSPDSHMFEQYVQQGGEFSESNLIGRLEELDAGHS